MSRIRNTSSLWLLFLIWSLTAFCSASARAQKVALWRIDPLGGLKPDVVASLESLLTQELGRLCSEIVPSAKTLALQQRNRRLRSCQGADACIAALGRYLRARYVVTGNLASLGQNYVVTLKLVDSKSRTSVRRISQPLSGQPEQLIEAVRVAAYRLLAPHKLLGTLQIIVNLAGARLFLDGRAVGTSPLRSPLDNLTVGTHVLKITHPTHLDFIKKVDVRFQKTTTVRVNMVKPRTVPVPKGPTGPVVRDRVVPFYGKWWFWTAVTVVAVAVGATVGFFAGRALRPSTPPVVNCDNNACAGGPP